MFLKQSSKIQIKTHRLFCSLNSIPIAEPTYLQLRDGTQVPYPKGSRKVIRPGTVYMYGEKSIDAFYLPENCELDVLYNLSRRQYLKYRGLFLQQCRGLWLAVNSQGTVILGTTEARVRYLADRAFPFPVDTYHADCLGCEVLEHAFMDSTEPVEVFTVPSNLFSSLGGDENTEFLIRVDHSFEGESYNELIMKHDSGATMIGLSPETISNPPEGVLLNRGTSQLSHSPDGKVTLCNVYTGQYFRVSGLVFGPFDVIQSRVNLFGFPLLSKFKNVIDVTADEVISLTPLSKSE